MAHIDDTTLIAKTRNLARYFTEQRQVAWVALVGTILWGVIGYFKMPQRKDPDVPVRIVVVSTMLSIGSLLCAYELLRGPARTLRHTAVTRR